MRGTHPVMKLHDRVGSPHLIHRSYEDFSTGLGIDVRPRYGAWSYNIAMDMGTLRIAGREFESRLFVGTGKYRSFPEMVRCHEASGAEVVTVAVRRVNLTDRSKESMLDYLDRSKYFLLPNTAACFTADEAIRTARLGREAGMSNWVKLEVIGDERTLFPDNAGLVEATRTLV